MDTNIKDKQTVAVTVITYNSSVTVLETLDSIVKQSYGSEYIELIISDDSSKDNTVQVINEWLDLHQNKFHCVKFFSNRINVGISKNCNLAWKAVNSKWIKTIAGDDILIHDCLSNFMNYIAVNSSARVVFSRMILFNNFSNIGYSPQPQQINLFFKSAELQFNELCKFNFTIAPSSFISKEALELVGYCSEQYRNFEDLPLWLKLTKNGIKLDFIDAYTVKYRVSNSVSNSSILLINKDFQAELELFYRNEIWPSLTGTNKIYKYDKKIEFFSKKIISLLFNNRKNLYSLFFLKVLSFFRPIKYVNFFRRIYFEVKS